MTSLSLYAANACFSTDLSLNLTNSNLFLPMEFPIKFDTLSQDGPLYILRGHRLIIKKYCMVDFVLEKSADSL